MKGRLTVGLLLWTDTAGIGLLVAASDFWPIPLIMLLWSFGVTFASLAMGAAVMSIDRRAEPRWGAREWRCGSAPASGAALLEISFQGWGGRNRDRRDAVGRAEAQGASSKGVPDD